MDSPKYSTSLRNPKDRLGLIQQKTDLSCVFVNETQENKSPFRQYNQWLRTSLIIGKNLKFEVELKGYNRKFIDKD